MATPDATPDPGAATGEAADPLLRREAMAGRLLQQLVLGSALWVLAVAALAAVLSGIGLWHPGLAVPLSLAAAGVCWWAVRGIPAPPVPLWSAVLLVGVTLASGIWWSATHSEQVIPRRDAGSYAQGALSLADTHRRLVSSGVDEIGSSVLEHPGITLASPGFYAVGSGNDASVQPQFVIGPSAIYSLGAWAAGQRGLLVLPAWAMALGILALGVLANSVVGARWGPLAALGAAVLFPIVHTARATFSEPLATLTVTAGLLALVLAAGRTAGTARGRAAALAGFLLGATTLVRIDGLRETALLLVVAAVYAVRGERWPRALLSGAAAGTVVGFAAAAVLSYRYLGAIAGSLVPLVGMGLVLAAVCGFSMRRPALVQRAARAVSGGARGRWLPWLGAGLVVLLGLVLASRPLWTVSRQSPHDPGSPVVAGLQLRQGLPVDGGRTYAEQTVTWLSWWVGPVALLIAVVALAEAVRRILALLCAGEDRIPAWTGPLLVAAGSTLLTLVRPGITPDHPWAERRLLVALPFVVVLVVAATAVLTRWSTRRLPAGAAVVPAVALPLTLLVPAALATWPHRGERVEAGSAQVVASVCAALQPGDVVLTVDSRAANEWPQVVRGQCGRTVLSTTKALRENLDGLGQTVRAVDATVRANGGRLVLLTADSDKPLRDLGASSRLVVDTQVREDARLLERRPDHLVTLRFTVWVGQLMAP
jgi:hypothetical protein